jgi:predicted secreted Zn-dependent protease
LTEISERELKRLWLKMISDIKDDSNKRINEARKSIQDLDNKISNMEEKFMKQMKITKKKKN